MELSMIPGAAHQGFWGSGDTIPHFTMFISLAILGNAERNQTGSFRLALFLPSPCQLLLQGLGVFTGGKPGQEAGHSQVLVQIGPVDVSAVAKNLKTIALLGCAVPQSRIPNQGHDNGASVHQIHRQRLVSYGDLLARGSLFSAAKELIPSFY